MNQPLDDLFNQADKQLETLEAESKQRELLLAPEQEVDAKTAARFNRVPARIPGHPLWKWIGVMLLPFLAASIYMRATMPLAIGPYHLITGIVQNSAISWSGRVHWGSIATEKVALPDGSMIVVRSDRGLLLQPGTPIMLRLYDTGAIRPEHGL